MTEKLLLSQIVSLLESIDRKIKEPPKTDEERFQDSVNYFKESYDTSCSSCGNELTHFYPDYTAQTSFGYRITSRCVKCDAVMAWHDFDVINSRYLGEKLK